MPKKSKDLEVGDILVLRKKDRIPADVVILSTIPNGANQAGEVGAVIPLRRRLFTLMQRRIGNCDLR